MKKIILSLLISLLILAFGATSVFLIISQKKTAPLPEFKEIEGGLREMFNEGETGKSFSETEKFYGKKFPVTEFVSYQDEKKAISIKSKDFKIIASISGHCGACIDDIPNMNELKKVETFFIPILASKEEAKAIKEAGLEAETYYGDRNLIENFIQESYVPSYFILNKENKVVFVMVGNHDLDTKLKVINKAKEIFQ